MNCVDRGCRSLGTGWARSSWSVRSRFDCSRWGRKTHCWTLRLERSAAIRGSPPDNQQGYVEDEKGDDRGGESYEIAAFARVFHPDARHKLSSAPRPGRVARAVRTALQDSEAPMQVRAIHRACEQLLGETVSLSTVKDCLSEHSRGSRPRFVRIAPGMYGIRDSAPPSGP